MSPRSHSQVSRACPWAVVANGPDVLGDHVECLDGTWISSFFFLSRFSKQHSSHFTDHIV